MTDRAHGFIRAFKVTAASRHDGTQMKDIARMDIMAAGVWADTACRSKASEQLLARTLDRIIVRRARHIFATIEEARDHATRLKNAA